MMGKLRKPVDKEEYVCLLFSFCFVFVFPDSWFALKDRLMSDPMYFYFLRWPMDPQTINAMYSFNENEISESTAWIKPVFLFYTQNVYFQFNVVIH